MLEKFKSDLITAMKEKDKVVLSTLRSVKGALQLEVINKRLEESDELLLDVISKQIKMRKDSVSEFSKANREDLVASYTKEIEILSKYMPKALTDDELNAIIDEVIAIVKPESIKDLGKVMKEVTPKVKNRCDMSKLNGLIRSKIQVI